MDTKDFERLGLNKNEARVYLELLKKGQSIASEIVKSSGMHRNIIYDNLNKLIEKGLATSIIEDRKKKYIAQGPDAIIEYLNNKSKKVQEEIKSAKEIIPEIKGILETAKEKQEASLFKGTKAVKKLLEELLRTKEFWIIGVSNASIDILGETYWNNFNIKAQAKDIKEHLLVNEDFKDTVNLSSRKRSKIRKLPKELTQVTEIVIFHNKAAIFVYSQEPTAVLIENKEVCQTFIQQFNFLWKLSKES